MQNNLKITALLRNHEEELVRRYTEPSYYLLNRDRKPDERLAKFLHDEIEDPQDHNERHILVKQNFRLAGLIRGYDLNKRCKLSEARAIRAVYGFIKRKIKDEKVLQRLEKDYKEYKECN